MGRDLKVLRHGFRGASPGHMREEAIRYRAPGGVKEPVQPIHKEAIREAIAAQTCPWCGRGPFAMLPVHTNKVHGVDKWELRELAGYTTRDALCSEESRAKMAAAYDVERGAQVRAATAASKHRRPQRWTTAGLERQSETITQWMTENPEAAREAQQRASRAVVSPEGRQRQIDASRNRVRSQAEIDAFRARMARPEIRAKREAARVLQPCGSVASYKRGCRCDACRAAKRESRESTTGDRQLGVERAAAVAEARPPRPVEAPVPLVAHDDRCQPQPPRQP